MFNSKVADHPMPKPRVVALTGGMGSGKSTVRKLFAELGVPCIDADQVARTIHQNPAHPVMMEIKDVYPELVGDDGRLYRGSLLKRLSVDAEANSTIKRLLKPYVLAEIESWTRKMNSTYVVWESALIIEENIRADRNLVVDAENKIRVERILARNPGWTIDQIQLILAIQLPRNGYLANADDVIKNDAHLDDLRCQVEVLHHMYIKNWS